MVGLNLQDRTRNAIKKDRKGCVKQVQLVRGRKNIMPNLGRMGNHDDLKVNICTNLSNGRWPWTTDPGTSCLVMVLLVHQLGHSKFGQLDLVVIPQSTFHKMLSNLTSFKEPSSTGERIGGKTHVRELCKPMEKRNSKSCGLTDGAPFSGQLLPFGKSDLIVTQRCLWVLTQLVDSPVQGLNPTDLFDFLPTMHRKNLSGRFIGTLCCLTDSRVNRSFYDQQCFIRDFPTLPNPITSGDTFNTAGTLSLGCF